MKRTWAQSAAAYLRPRSLAMLGLGFSAGLPFLLVFSTLTAWLSEAGVARTAIGAFGWIGTTYSIKVVWAPLVDRLPLPGLTAWLGRRRSWMLVGQLGIFQGIFRYGRALAAPLSLDEFRGQCFERVTVCFVFRRHPDPQKGIRVPVKKPP